MNNITTKRMCLREKIDYCRANHVWEKSHGTLVRAAAWQRLWRLLARQLAAEYDDPRDRRRVYAEVAPCE